MPKQHKKSLCVAGYGAGSLNQETVIGYERLNPSSNIHHV